jgi:predicted metal-binding protein
MQEIKSKLGVHVFVCTNKKEGKPCCAAKQGEALRSALKEWSKENPAWKGRLRINASGCLDHCSDGVAIAIYPQNIWITGASLENIDELKRRITGLMANT